jgi:hypothetical protein
VFLAALASRAMAVRVQDRVIRLEMRLRLAAVLPGDLRAEIPKLATRQLVALRFASDAELPGLVRQVLAGSLRDQKAIKQAIVDWQADHLRACRPVSPRAPAGPRAPVPDPARRLLPPGRGLP